MEAGVGAGASLNRNLEAGVLPEAWMIFPNQFAPYFSISSSNSGNVHSSQPELLILSRLPLGRTSLQ